MSIADKIQRLQTAKTNIGAAITAKGGIVDGHDGFEEFADDIATISAGANLDDFISGKMSEVTSNLEVIPDFAFSAKGELTTVNLPEATYIGRFAFSSAAGATSGSGSGSNAEGGEGDEGDEGEDMNFNNKKLVTVVMPKVTNIESSAFAGDENLEITSLPATVLVIQDKAFQGCPKVQLTALPENLTYLGDGALDAQDNLGIDALPATLMYLGAGVTREQITTYLSQFVDSETGILDLSQVPAQWLQMEIFDYILQGNSRFSGLDVGTEIEIPSGILALADRLFAYTVQNVETIVIPEGLLDLGNNTFNGCNALTTLTLPDSITSLGDYTFNGCNALTTIDMTAFDGSAVPYLASSNAFYANTHAVGFKFVFATQEALNAFANETNWSDLAQYFEVQA